MGKLSEVILSPRKPRCVLRACALWLPGEGVADRLPDAEAGGGPEGAQVLRVLHSGEEQQRGMRHSQHGWHLHHLGPCVGTCDGEDRAALTNPTMPQFGGA